MRQRQIKILRRPQIVGRKPSESMSQENVVLVADIWVRELNQLGFIVDSGRASSIK